MNCFKDKHILIRADSSTNIGTGHIMRTHVLAKSMQEQGASITYACRDCPGHLISFLKDQRYTIQKLENDPNIEFNASDYSTWLGQDVERDIEETFKKHIYDLVILDHYGADITWQKRANMHTKHLLVIDDEDLRDFDCDILLNQNLPTKKNNAYQNKANRIKSLLIGPKYALLRPEFFEQRKGAQTRSRLDKILILMGGADKARVTQKVAEHIDIDRNITIVIGNAYTGEDSLRSICKAKNINLIKGANNISELMANADLCIGAGGTTSWERCCMKLPGLIFSIADNQITIAQNLDEAGAIRHLGTPEAFDFSALNPILSELKLKPNQLEKMSKAASSLCDGQGARRVISEISSLFAA